VLADLPHVVEAARARLAGRPHAHRFEFAAGSFFDAVPEGGDAYLLKHILHDWDDERSLRILENCRRAMTPASRLLVVEVVLQPGNDPHFGKILDLEMIAMTEGGRERTEAEFAQLLREAGLALSAVVPTRAPTSILEARPA
jgi:O-methyltransferase domain